MRYKVGDKVRIKSLDWYNENKDNYDCVYAGNGFGFWKNMTRHCGETMKITTVKVDPEDSNKGYYFMENSEERWTDEMIEGLVEEENKPKFKVGDEVRIKGTDIGGTIESVIRGQLIVNSKGSKIPAWPEDVVLMKSVEEEKPLCEGCCSLELKYNKLTIADNICTDEVEIILQDYELKQRGDQWFAVKKKKEYPKTLEVCCEVLDTGGYQIDYFVKPGEVYEYEKALITKISALYNLIICRDAYWQLYGEEMGFGKPWEPDWNDADQKRYVIAYFCGNIEKSRWDYGYSTILTFPTEEMRDAFYDNFKGEIESCKELL